MNSNFQTFIKNDLACFKKRLIKHFLIPEVCFFIKNDDIINLIKNISVNDFIAELPTYPCNGSILRKCAKQTINGVLNPQYKVEKETYHFLSGVGTFLIARILDEATKTIEPTKNSVEPANLQKAFRCDIELNLLLESVTSRGSICMGLDV